MATALQRQINQLKSSNVTVTSIQKGRPSLYFDPKEAAAIDVEDIYESAIIGLKTLQQYDIRFDQFLPTLFHPSSVRSQRDLMNEEENANLNKELNSILNLISLYVAEKSAHTVLEYLIRRYKVHEFNIDSFILSIIQQHESKIFPRAVQLCELKGTPWEFLEGVKKNGVPLPKQLLVKQLKDDNRLLTSLRDATMKAIHNTSGMQIQSSSRLASGIEKTIFFFASLVVEVADGRALTDRHIRILCAYFFGSFQAYAEGSIVASELRSTWLRSTFVILVQISASTRLASPMLHRIVEDLSIVFKTHCKQYRDFGVHVGTMGAHSDVLCFLAVICRSQSLPLLSAKALRGLFCDGAHDQSFFLETISELGSRFEIADLLHAIAAGLIEVVKSAYVVASALVSIPVGTTASRLISAREASSLLKVLLVRRLLSTRGIKIVLEAYIKLLGAEYSSSNVFSTPAVLDTALRMAALDTVRFVSEAFPTEFDSCIRAIDVRQRRSQGVECSSQVPVVEDPANDEVPPVISVRNILGDAFVAQPYRIPTADGLSLLLSLASASAEVRVQALGAFAERVPRGATITQDLVGLSEAVLRNMIDANAMVASAAWTAEIALRIVDYVPSQLLLQATSTALANWKSSLNRLPKRSSKMLSRIFKVVMLPDVASAISSVASVEDENGQSSSSTSSQTYESQSLSGNQWLVLSLLEMLCDPLYIANANGAGTSESSDKPHNKDERSSFEKVSNIVWKCASTLGRAGTLPLFRLLSNAPVEKVNVDANANLVALSVSQAALEPIDHGTSLKMIHDIVEYLQSPSVAVTSPLLLFLSAFAEAFDFSLGTLQRTKEAEAIFSSIAKLLLRLTSDASTSSIEIKNLCVVALTALMRCRSFGNPSTAASSSAPPRSLADLVATLVIPVDFHSIRMRVLATALASSEPSMCALIGPILSPLSQEGVAIMLMQVVLQLQLASSSHADARSTAAVAGAIYALASWVESSFRPSFLIQCQSNKSLLPQQVSALLLLLSVMALHFVIDESTPLRKAALSLHQKLVALNSSAKVGALSLSFDDSRNVSIASVGIITAFSGSILEKLDTIRMDSAAARVIVSASLFPRPPGNKDVPARLNPLQYTMLKIAEHFGWALPTIATTIVDLASTACHVNLSWEVAKILLENVIEGNVVTNGVNAPLVQALLNIMVGIKNANDVVQSEIIEAVSLVLSSRHASVCSIVGNIATIVTREWVESLHDSSLLRVLYLRLASASVKHQGLASFIAAIEAVASAHASTNTGELVALAIQECVLPFQALLDRSLPQSGQTSHAVGHVILAAINSQTALFEVFNASLKHLPEKSTANELELRKILLILFRLLKSLNDSSLHAVLAIDYLKTLLMDIVLLCLTPLGAANRWSAGRLRQRKLSGDSDDQSLYSSDRISTDVDEVIKSLHRARTLQLHASSLATVRALLLVNPSATSSCVASLGKYLSVASAKASSQASTAAASDSLDKFVDELLHTLVSILKSGQQSDLFSAQDILQSLLQYAPVMASPIRSLLVSKALAYLGPTALPNAVGVLLSHALITFELERETSAASLSADVSDSASSGDALVLLSISSQRKARRAQKKTKSDELFRLAVDSSIASTAQAQLSNLVALAEFVGVLFDRVTSQLEVDALPRATEEAEDAEDSGEQIIMDAPKLQGYCATLTSLRTSGMLSGATPATLDAADIDAANEGIVAEGAQKGVAAALAVLHLEFILDVLEHRGFHASLAGLIEERSSARMQGNSDEEDQTGHAETGASSHPLIQTKLLEFCDHLLQLQTSALHMQTAVGASGDSFVDISIGSTALRISISSLGRTISNLCLDTLKSLEKLLDAPTFVTIFQELLDHDDSAVRQRALQLMGQRLQLMSEKKGLSGPEGSLFLDLVQRLRSIANEIRPALETEGSLVSSSFSGSKVDQVSNLGSITSRVGLTQSALMCIDIISQAIAAEKSPSVKKVWVPVIVDVLGDAISLASFLSSYCFGTPLADEHLTIELCKLLGSNYLLCGGLCGVVGPKALSHLATLMETVLSAIAFTSSPIRLSALSSTIPSSVGAAASRAHVLLIRSALSAVTNIVHNLPSFVHLYLPRILLSALPLHGVDAGVEECTSGSSAGSAYSPLSTDAARCLSLIVRSIPPRLCIPALLTGCPSILSSANHVVAFHFASLVGALVGSLDRVSISSHLADLYSIAMLCIDYRRAYGTYQSASSDRVDDAVVDFAIQLTLKLTETELKGFLVELTEWRDIDVTATLPGPMISYTSEWEPVIHTGKRTAPSPSDPSSALASANKKYSRGVVFYKLTSAMCGKLKRLFVPCLEIMWTHAIGCLSILARSVDLLPSLEEAVDPSGSSKKKKKKRKTEAAAAAEFPDDDAASKTVQYELITQAKNVLETVRLACVHDASNCIEESHYESAMPEIVSLLSAKEVFQSDTAYLDFCSASVAPCLAALARVVGKEILWKPLNHKLLLLTRDTSRVVRVAAVKALHCLFTELGEEYLGMLPECLSFVSELFEDDSPDVTEAVNDFARLIEELSGESINTYLQ